MSFASISMSIVKDWELVIYLLDIDSARQAALELGKELAVVQIDFSTAFDRVSHYGFLYKLHDMRVGCADFEVIAGFLSGSVQRVVVDGVRIEKVRVVSGVLQGKLCAGLITAFALH